MTDFPPLTPPVDLSRAPPLHEMNTHPKRFEGLTAQLLGLESHLHRATLFGIGGEAQFGLDAIAERLDGSGFEGASCKCWRSVQPSNLTTWSDEFLKHLEPRWREQPIRRFILVTAAENITQVNVLAQVALERERFKDVGIEYEVWGPDDVTRRLSGDRPTTQRFLDDVWANRLCGAAPADVAALSGLFDAARTAQLHGAQSALAGQTDARVATAKEALWIGDVDAALDAVTELRSPSVWSQLSPTVQASVVRLDGSLALHSRDFNRAEALAKEADLLSPAEPRLASHAAALRDGAAAGGGRDGGVRGRGGGRHASQGPGSEGRACQGDAGEGGGADESRGSSWGDGGGGELGRRRGRSWRRRRQCCRQRSRRGAVAHLFLVPCEAPERRRERRRRRRQ